MPRQFTACATCKHGKFNPQSDSLYECTALKAMSCLPMVPFLAYHHEGRDGMLHPGGSKRQPMPPKVAAYA